jgi:hypothetical protein
VLAWVPTEQVAEAVAGLAGVQAEIVNLDQAAADGDTTLPASAAKVQFCVLPFFPQEPAIADVAGLLPWADVVVLLAPVTSETIGMVDAAFLAAMKDGALFVKRRPGRAGRPAGAGGGADGRAAERRAGRDPPRAAGCGQPALGPAQRISHPAYRRLDSGFGTVITSSDQGSDRKVLRG